MRTFFASVMVICSMVLMQTHSIDFWMEKAGASGWAWSIGLEVAMLWFWYENKRCLQVFKYLAAFLLIAGPWYQITAPTFQNLNSVTVMQAEISAAQDTVTQLSTSLDRYEKRSDKRSGWAGRIDKTQAKLEEARSNLSILRSKKAKKEAPWRSRAVAGMQAAALLIVLTAQLAAVTSLRSRNGSPVTKTVTEKRNGKGHIVTPEQLPERYEEMVSTVAAEIIRRVSEFGSQAKLCKDLGLRPADVSMVLNHNEKKEAGKGTIGGKALQKISGVLEMKA
jgi:hypothetical protein